MKQWKKKTGALILSLCLALGMALPAAAEGEPQVAIAGGTTYATLAEAIENVDKDGEVALLKDTQENITVAKEKEFTLDLNGKTLSGGTGSNKAALTNLGTVTILDSSAAGAGMIRREDVDVPGYYVVLNKGTMVIQSGKVYNHTGLAPRGASLVCNVGSSESAKASLTIEGGELKQDGFIAVKNDDYGELAITGGTITATGTDGRYVISAVQNWHEATISGGVINGAVWTGVWDDNLPDSKTTLKEDATVNGMIVARREVVNNYTVETARPEIEIQGGIFNASWAVEAIDQDPIEITLSGGDFTSLPARYTIADDKAVLPGEKKGYAYTIGEKPETEVIPAKPKVDVASTVGQETAEAVQEALVDGNASLEGQGLEVQVNEKAKQAPPIDDELKAALQEALKTDDTPNPDVRAAKIVVQPYMDIEITDAVETDGSKTLTLDITPMSRTVATTAGSEDSIVVVPESGEKPEGANAVVVGKPAPLAITGPVTVSLPLPVDFVGGADTLYVNHEKNRRTYIYTGSVDDNVLTFSNPHGFSKFTITGEGPAASIGQVGYPSLQAAVDAVQNGEAITVQKDNETARVSRTVTFYAEAAEGQSFSFTIEAGANTIAGENNGTDGKFVFTRSGSGGGEEEPEEWQNPFTDVKKNDWFYEAVAFVHENNLFLGTTDTTFAPGLTMERGMLATVLYRLEQEPAAGSASFSDVKKGAYYADAVSWAASQNLVEGYGDGTFGPKDAVTREQLAAVLYRYAKYKGWDVSGSASLEGFTDSEKASGYAKEALAWAVDAGILQGYGNGLLNPQGSATRAEVAQMLQRFCEIYQAK